MSNFRPYNAQGPTSDLPEWKLNQMYDEAYAADRNNSWVSDAGNAMWSVLGLKDSENPLSFFTGEKDFNYSLDMLDKEMEYNKELASSAQQFNAGESLLAREFNALEASKQRAFESAEAAKSREFNHAEALLNREWQERMSNTAIQRATADYKAAGLNPYLAYSQGGAPVTSGSSASSSIPTGGSASAHAASVNPSSVRGSLGKVQKMTDLFATIVNTALSFSKIGATLSAMAKNQKPVLTEKVFTYDRKGRRTTEYFTYD